MFWKTNEKHLQNSEYEFLCKKLTEVNFKIGELENNIKILTTNYDNLRGNFNRKLSGLKKEDAKEEMGEKETNIKPNIFLSPNGTAI